MQIGKTWNFLSRKPHFQQMNLFHRLHYKILHPILHAGKAVAKTTILSVAVSLASSIKIEVSR